MDSLHLSLTSDVSYACEGVLNHLIASGAESYQWSPTSLFSNNDEEQNILLTADTEIKVESSNRCFTDSAKVFLELKDTPVIAKAADTLICHATPAYLHATYNAGYGYKWTPALTLDQTTIHNPVATPAVTTTYYAEVDNGFCTAYDTVLVTVLDELVAEIDASALEGDIPFTSTLTSHNVATTYAWYVEGSSTPFSTAQQTPYLLDKMGDTTIYLVVTNNAGCRAKDSVSLLGSYIFIPNLITPNGDGDNDTYILVLFGHEWSITVVNRWGQQVYSNDNYHNEWGADNVVDGMYYYEIVEKRSKRTWKGWVHVMSRRE